MCQFPKIFERARRDVSALYHNFNKDQLLSEKKMPKIVYLVCLIQAQLGVLGRECVWVEIAK